MKYPRRTDLALEARELAEGGLPEGVGFEEEETPFCTVFRVCVPEGEASERLGKAHGKYVTLSFAHGDLRTSAAFEGAAEEFSRQLRSLLTVRERDCVLVACLGNMNVTPDALGPLAAEHIIATRHLKSSLPEYFSSIRPVCVLSPGVLGSTGLESGEILKGAVERSGARAVIAIDALASRRLERVCSTVQLTDTGITPGSGVGNSRFAIDSSSMGVEVIAVGVPTVVDAATLAADVISDAGFGEPTREQLLRCSEGVIGTPRDIDAKLRSAARLIGIGIDLALHEGLSVSDVADLMPG